MYWGFVFILIYMVLKLGSKGKEVELLQSYLKITVDGVFGPGTEKAVKQFQKERGLTEDGIVGSKTWSILGLASTDQEEKVNDPDFDLDIKPYYLPIGESVTANAKKEWIFLHHTAGWHNPYQVVDAWAKDDRGTIATEFIIGGQSVKGGDIKYDGEVIQAFPKGNYAWHLGTGNNIMHKCSTGIEVCNFGAITNGKTYVNVPADSAQIVTLAKPFRGYQHWHAYSNKQLKALKKLILYLANRDLVDIHKGLIPLIKSKGADAFDLYDPTLVEKTKGLWSHTNVRKDKVDMFPQQELLDMLLSL
jgi:hypothetical protein